jgi:hypothetical protein
MRTAPMVGLSPRDPAFWGGLIGVGIALLLLWDIFRG